MAAIGVSLERLNGERSTNILQWGDFPFQEAVRVLFKLGDILLDPTAFRGKIYAITSHLHVKLYQVDKPYT